jgi:hypothetical protein
MTGGMEGRVSSRRYGGQEGTVGDEIDATVAALEWHTDRIAEVRRHALSVTLLSWESPAGANVRSYLFDRCAELARTIDLLESVAVDLRRCGLLVQNAELLQRGSGAP